jgi:superfamily II DNA/RNA helicase
MSAAAPSSASEIAASAAATAPAAADMGASLSVDDFIITGIDDSYEVLSDFNMMGLPDDLARGVYANGFQRPSKIQKVAILPMRQGRDILAQSQSGTGKTGTFVIGSLTNVDIKINAPQVLVINPTRELAEQTQKNANAIGSFLGLKTMTAIGGSSVQNDIRELQRGVHFVSGTPGRLFDLIDRGALRLDNIRYLIFDEADQLLEEGFFAQIREILGTRLFPASTHLAMFSATMPEAVLELAETFLNKPVRILLRTEEISLKGIRQFYVGVDREEWKFAALMELYKHLSIDQAIIFVNKRAKAEQLTRMMVAEGFPLEYIHGDMDPHERRRRLEEFRLGKVHVLIATDILARGIDVQTVSMVVNYEMSPSRENYFHRIGRCGRYGRKGVSINLLCGDMEMSMQRDIERHYEITIPELEDPDQIRKFL